MRVGAIAVFLGAIVGVTPTDAATNEQFTGGADARQAGTVDADGDGAVRGAPTIGRVEPRA